MGDPLNMLDPSGAAMQRIDGVSVQETIVVEADRIRDPFFVNLNFSAGGIVSSMTLVGQEPTSNQNPLQDLMDRSAAQGWSFISSSGREYMGQGSIYQNSSGRGGGGSGGNGSGQGSSSNSSSIVEWIQTGLDVVGLIPAVGEVADGINAAIYLANGDYLNAGLITAAMIPFAGWGATGAKLGVKGMKAFDAARSGMKFLPDIVTKATKNHGHLMKSQRHARNIDRQKLGKNPVQVGANKWRSDDGKWQYRAKPGDLNQNHIHIEELNPATGEVLNNHHLYWK